MRKSSKKLLIVLNMYSYIAHMGVAPTKKNLPYKNQSVESMPMPPNADATWRLLLATATGA